MNIENMKKENDEIIELFRTHLADAGMPVKDGFWEKLSEDIPVANRHRHRVLLLRVAAAASVTLVLAVSSAVLWYLSPKEEIGEAFTKIALTNGGQMDGDGVRINQLPLAVAEPVLSKPASKVGVFSHQTEEEDSVTITFSMSFSFTASEGQNVPASGRSRNGYWQASHGGTDETATSRKESGVVNEENNEVAKKHHAWALKAMAGMALPADDGTYKIPVSVGVTLERKLNKRIGLEAGILYSNLRSTGQHLHYLGIPVKVNFTLADTNRFNLYATVGGVADKCIAGAPDNSFGEEPIQLAVTAGIGVQYKISDRLALFAEPGVSHHFKTDSGLETIRTRRPTNFNLLCGLRMTY